MKTPHKITLSTINLLAGIYIAPLMAETITPLQTVTTYGEQNQLQERQQAPSNLIIVDQTEIERFDDRTAGDILRRLPGVLFGGAPGESKDIRIRGLDKEYSQVLINGRRIPGGGEKREFQLDRLPADLIERIELIRAPTADMDSQGIAGTVNIILKTIPEGSSASIKMGTSKLQGGDSKPNISLSYGKKNDGFGYLYNLNTQQRQLQKNKTKQDFKADGSADKSEQETEDKAFDEVQLAPSLNWTLSKQDTLSVEPILLFSDEEKIKEKLKFKADSSLDGKELEAENKERLNWGLNTEWQHTYASGNEFTLGLNLQESKEDKNKLKQFYKGDGSLDKSENEIEDKSDQEWQLSLKGKKFVGDQHALKAGIDLSNKDRTKDKQKTENKNGESADKTALEDIYEIEEQRFNAYMLDEYSLNERHLFTPGMRFEWTDTDIASGTDISKTSNDALWNPSIHYLFKWSDQTNVRASVTRTVRRPKFNEMAPYVDSKDGTLDKPDKAGNPDLLPELATGLDVGMNHYFLDQAGNIGINVFYRNIDDKIETRVNTNAVSARFEERPENVGEATLKGIELDASQKLTVIGLNNLTLKGNLTAMDGEITDENTGAKTPFKEQADYVYNLGFDHRIAAANIHWGMNLNKVSERETDEIKDGKRTIEILEPEEFLDLYAKKTIGKDFEVQFSAQNLLAVEKDKEKTIFNADGSIDKTERELEQSGRVYNLSLIRRW